VKKFFQEDDRSSCAACKKILLSLSEVKRVDKCTGAVKTTRS
jgi:hypothetical protein